MPDAPAGAPDAIGRAIDQIRATAKWITGAFAAVGAALAGQSILSNFGKASGGRLLLGAIAGALGLSLLGGVPRPERAATICAFAGAVLLLAFTQTHVLGIAYVLLAAMGLVDTLMYALANTYVQQIAGDDDRGHANAVFSLAFLGGAPLGNALLGILAGRFGSLVALSWSGAAVALAAVAFGLAFRGTRAVTRG